MEHINFLRNIKPKNSMIRVDCRKDYVTPLL